MLSSIDKALAGAIDIIADDVTNTVKSVKEKGWRSTLGDAVEDAAGMVVGGAGTVLSGVMGGKKGPETISGHSGISSSYADICSGKNGMGGGMNGAAFPYTPNGSAGKPNIPKFTPGGFGPGIGIQRAGPPAGVQAYLPQNNGFVPPNIQPYNGGGGAKFPYNPSPAPYIPTPAYTPAPAMNTATATPSAANAAPSPTANDAKLGQDAIDARFEVLRKQDAANTRCFDCNAPNAEWASVSFGVFVCIACSGHHRQLGTHISRIRSCKMDSWTDRQIKIFNSGGNARLQKFFEVNQVAASTGFNRYMTPAAEWYRESWIKSRALERDVPPPPAGIQVGPCVDTSAKTKKAEAAAPKAPQADLLDFGSEPVAKPAAPAAAQADLLGFGGEPAPAAKPAAMTSSDLLGVAGPTTSTPASTGGGDLLGLGGSAGGGDLFSLASTAANARPPSSALASLNLDMAPASTNNTLGAPPAMQPANAAATMPMGSAGAPQAAANTLGGGACLAQSPQKPKDVDPFAMAMEKWGM